MSQVGLGITRWPEWAKVENMVNFASNICHDKSFQASLRSNQRLVVAWALRFFRAKKRRF